MANCQGLKILNMFQPCDAILCFYLLIGQNYFVSKAPNFNKPIAWFENKALITNENLFDINELIKLQDSSQEINGTP